ncbi:MAG: exported protein of unknown function [Nitrososphaeraceae archaeon]|nr:exported protein of unknown function [Nitrososphaeraceae archaeon]
MRIAVVFLLSILFTEFIVIIPIQQAKAQQISFGTPINLSNNAGVSHTPEIAVAGNNVYVVWSDSSSGNFEIFFSRSTDGGATFSSPIVLGQNGRFFSLPQITASGNNVYTVWEGESSGNLEIFYSRSTDGGATFSSPINLSNNIEFSFNPKIAQSGNNIYVIWTEDAMIFFSRSTDGGATFSSPMDLSNGRRLQSGSHIAASGNNVYIAGTGNSGINIYFIRSTDGGATFTSPINLSNNPGTGVLDFPKVTTSGDNVYMVWRDNTAIASGNIEIFFTRSTNGGFTFDIPINLSSSPGGSDPAEIDTSGSSVYVIWRDNLGPSSIYSDILFARSTNNGSNFTTINLSNTTTGDSLFPQMTVFGNNISAVWSEKAAAASAGRPYDPFFSKSKDGGATFTSPIDIGSIPGGARDPRIAESDDGGKVHVVWSENEQEIYYVTNTVSNLPPNCIGAFPNKDILWPADRTMRNITINGVTDPDGDPISIKITNIFQDEPTKVNPGDPSPDGAGIGTDTAEVRAQRLGNGDGRVYYIGFTADDGKGGKCDGEVLVGVPLYPGQTPIPSGRLYDSTKP